MTLSGKRVHGETEKRGHDTYLIPEKRGHDTYLIPKHVKAGRPCVCLVKNAAGLAMEARADGWFACCVRKARDTIRNVRRSGHVPAPGLASTSSDSRRVHLTGCREV